MKRKLGSSAPSKLSIISICSEGLLSPRPRIANNRLARSDYDSPKVFKRKALRSLYLPWSGGFAMKFAARVAVDLPSADTTW